MKIWNTYEEILADLMADKPKPKPPPAVTAAGKARERFSRENQPTEAVFDAATRGNDAAIEQLEETMEQRRQKQMAKELAEHNAEGPAWHNLVQWRQSLDRAQERLRELDGENPLTGNYDPDPSFRTRDEGKMTKVAQQQWTYDEVALTMAQHLHAYAHNNGPDLEAEDLAIPCDAFSIEKRKAKWTKVKRDKLNLIGARFDALRPKIDEAKRKLAEVEPAKVVAYRRYDSLAKMVSPAEADFSVPQFQPRVAKVEKDTIVEAKIVEFAKRKPLEPEPAEARSEVALVGFVQQPTPSALCLSPETPMDNAQAILSLRAWHKEDQMPIWRYWQKSFWQWHNGCWREVDDDTVSASIWHELNAADKRVKHYKHRFEPKPADVSATIAALKAAVNLPADKAMPGWFGEGQPDGDLRELVACRNGILHIPTRTLLRHTPKFWSPNVLDFDFDPDAKAERFVRFLEEIWPRDTVAQECVSELYGLCLTDVTEFQKCFMFVGPPRGGRGTMGRVLRGLIGAQNYIGTSLKRFGEPFGMESFIGKKVAVFSDATIDGVTPALMANIVERTKQISGEDEIDVNRKNHRYWHGKLNSRLVYFCNELLRLEDESGALAERMLVYRMRKTIPKEKRDTKLTDKLLAERSGILNLALDGWDRVCERGSLRQPQTGLEMLESFAELSSDVSRFVADCCEVGPKHEVSVQSAFTAWKNWCEVHGIRRLWSDKQFSVKLRSAVPTINDGRPRVEGTTKRPTILVGIGVKRGWLYGGRG